MYLTLFVLLHFVLEPQQYGAWLCLPLVTGTYWAGPTVLSSIYVHGSVNRDSMSIIVQRDATIYSFIIFLQTALHVSEDTLIHHQEHTQTVITTSGTGRTFFVTVR